MEGHRFQDRDKPIISLGIQGKQIDVLLDTKTSYNLLGINTVNALALNSTCFSIVFN